MGGREDEAGTEWWWEACLAGDVKRVGREFFKEILGKKIFFDL